MPKHGACNLCSINLSEYVTDPYTDNAKFNYNALQLDMPFIVRAMDDILSENLPNHALAEQREMAENYRNLGIGIMGLADTLVKLGLRYGSQEAVMFTNNLMCGLFRCAVYASVELGKQRGSFPKYTSEVWDSSIINRAFHPDEIAELKKQNTLRNCSLLSIAPTGSIGTMLNVSTGCEPFFMISYQRRTVSLNNEETFYTVNIPVAQEYYKNTGATSLPDYFVTAAQIDWKERIDMQAAMQNYVDTAISSTLNLPKETTPADIKGIYLRAWSKGLKGVTVYVDGSRDPILSSGKEEQKPTQCFDCISPTSRKEIGTTYGQTMCKKCACGTLYITANKDKDGNFVELFTHTSKGGICQANLNAVTRGISLALRSGIKVAEIIDQLKGIHCPACAMAKAKKQPIDGMSCPDIISKAMSEFTKPAGSDYDIDKGNACPECGAPLVHTGGCVSCSCGWSRCG